MDRICERYMCTGCGACTGICPTDCISLKADENENGHIYPFINKDKCIDCGLCERTCPVNRPINLNKPIEVNASYAVDELICNSSSSGGLAYTIGAEIINQGGIVYGSVIEYGLNFGIRHKRIDSIADLAKTQGSKYVHSKIDREIYQFIKSDLTSNRYVLFIGTGCQIAGVRNFLKKDYPNFYAIDIICHGVPSAKILEDYLSRKYDPSQIKKLSFRNKSDFNIYGVYGVYGEQIKLPLYKNLYMMGFMKGLYYRSACYGCHYASSERGGDITLGDFWGLKVKFDDRPETSKGTSVVLVNTEKGKSLIDFVKSNLALMRRPLGEAVAGNPQLRHPSKKHYAYSLFKRLYPIVDFRIAASLSLVREKIFYSLVLPALNKLRSK